MPNLYGYIRLSPKMTDPEALVRQITEVSPDLQLFRETGIRGNIPAEARPQYRALCEALQPGDQLVVRWITDLGFHFDACHQTLRQLLDQGVIVRTLTQPLTFKAECPITDALLLMLKGYASSQTQQRLWAAEASRHTLRKDSAAWQEKFRGRRANHALHREIAQLLRSGKTLQSVAEETGASLSTVKRVKAKMQQNDL
ncbi:recombinase family protein [Photobacterium sp. 1_MG-2023]|uniref:recombinase family protein n=1 Tax=Photobacterium sp. 1_MG-2023 TaxID=3062646 RepID=UPI0026E18218|nr:recombinase family protein [Photobacterium sp. 1_MG-2023]MDO6708756.1 recombinase family protein [Photobacterium sp. 1_MG-2023]